jgi:anti-anti-sigma regulatory factor
MWKVQRLPDNGFVVLRLSGRLEGEQLSQLQEVFESEGGSQDLVLDLKEVRLVDQEAVTFLAGCEADGAQIRNCPGYIREWIARERSAE